MLQRLGMPPKLILAVIFCSPYDDQIESGSSEFAFQEDQKLAKDKAQPLLAQGKDDPEVGEEEQYFKDRKKPAPEAAKADEPQVKKPRVATTPPTLKPYCQIKEHLTRKSGFSGIQRRTGIKFDILQVFWI